MKRTVTVLPCVRLPRSLGFFDYTYESEDYPNLVPGSFVDVPFRSQIVTGVVIETLDAVNNSLKALDTLRSDLPVLPREEMSYILSRARWYCVSPATMLRSMYSLPKTHKLRVSKKAATIISNPASAQLRLGSSVPIKSIQAHDDPSLIEYYADAIRTAHRNNEQIIIIAATSERVAYLQKRITSKHVIYQTSPLGVRAAKEIRNHSTNNTASAFVGTRDILSLPYKSIRIVIVDRSEDRLHKLPEGSVRADSCIDAYLKAKEYGASCIYASHAPRLEEYVSIKQETLASTSSEIISIDLHQSFRSGRQSFISEQLDSLIEQTLRNQQSVFLYLNHTGTSKYVVCKDCDAIFTCPTCGSYLRFTQNGQTLHCINCTYKQALPDRCAHCGGISFIFPGLGIEKIANELTRTYPDTPIHTVDAQSGFNNETDGQPMIVVGTSYMLHAGIEYIANTGLVAAIAADPIISMDELRSLEYQWQDLAGLMALPNPDSIRALQWFNTDSFFAQTFAGRRYDEFASAELATRKRYRLPPFSRHITCVYTGHPMNRTNATQTLVSKLKTIDKDDISPIVTVIQASTKRAECVLLRFPVEYNSAWKIPPQTFDVISHLGSEWIIDPDPRIL